MPDHRTPSWSGRGRNRTYRGRHSAGAALELQGTTEPMLAGEPEPELEPVPEHVQGVPMGDTERVSLELHMAAAGAGDNDRSDGIWRV